MRTHGITQLTQFNAHILYQCKLVSLSHRKTYTESALFLSIFFILFYCHFHINKTVFTSFFCLSTFGSCLYSYSCSYSALASSSINKYYCKKYCFYGARKKENVWTTIDQLNECDWSKCFIYICHFYMCAQYIISLYSIYLK